MIFEVYDPFKRKGKRYSGFYLFLTSDIMATQYLIELLYEHNCVILPGFGGFIANRLPSKINEIQQRVEPARKIVAFNINLTQNDGLLANHLSKSKGISFDDANREINEYVLQIKSEIALKKHYALKGIGDFYLNSENKTVFIPEADINFSKETFGLFPITIRKIVREQEKQHEIEKVTHRTQPLKLEKPTAQRSRKWVYGTLLIALPLTLGLLSQQSGLIQKADFNISSIFKPSHPVSVTESHPSETNTTAAETNTVTTNSTAPLSTKPEATASIETAPAEVKSTPIPEETKVTNQASTVNHFHIIGGSFGVAGNAEKFVKQLHVKGYQAYIAGTNAKGLTMVSYGGFKSDSEAQQFLQKIHISENPQAWLFNN